MTILYKVKIKFKSQFSVYSQYCDEFDHLLGNGSVNTFTSVRRIGVLSYTTDMVTREYEAFP
jgi:hypothetical protein